MSILLSISSEHGPYPLVVGHGLLESFGRELAQLGIPTHTRLFIVTDESVQAQGYLQTLLDACMQGGYTTATAVIPPGDASKSWTVAESLFQQMLDAGIRRHGIVIALGGGVVGDLAGFVAATYLRGIRFIQVPTTLLAHDSSIGGKVGINLNRGKNLVGAFHAPIGVLYDVESLQTLPSREWQNGMAEVIKHGIIGDAALFGSLELTPMPSYPGAKRAEQLIAQACSVKIRVIEQDETERGIRMWLNLGHTVGHAVESVSHYALGHGEAVSIGLSVEAHIAEARGLLTANDRQRITKLLRDHKLPVTPPNYPFSQIVDVLEVDKKHTDDGWTFVLPQGIGNVETVRDVAYAEVQSAWEQALKERRNEE